MLNTRYLRSDFGGQQRPLRVAEYGQLPQIEAVPAALHQRMARASVRLVGALKKLRGSPEPPRFVEPECGPVAASWDGKTKESVVA